MQTIKRIPFSSFAKFANIRLGEYYELPQIPYKYISFLSVVESIESGSRPSGGIQEKDQGQAISLGGEQIGIDGELNVEKIPYVSLEFYKNATRGKIKDGDILLCKDGALTGKVCQVNTDLLPNGDVMANEHVYVIRANGKIDQRFLFYLMRTEIFQKQIKDFAFHKKGQPGLNKDHIKLIKIPEVPINLQLALINGTIIDKENQISNLQKNICVESKIIDDAFQTAFGFDYKLFDAIRLDENKFSSLSDFSNNSDLRFSVKFHRESADFVMKELTQRSDKKIKHFLKEPITLGASVSPADYSEEGKYCYISMATIKDWKFELGEANFVSEEYADSKLAKTVQKNDIIMARSGEGTIGKVAVIEDEKLKGIHSDFTMRIRLKSYNIMFAYYYFRTQYFQYLVEIYKKGLGNNTNIFPVVVKEFPLLDVPLDEQKSIANEINYKLINQKNVKQNIAELRNEIDQIIERFLVNS